MDSMKTIEIEKYCENNTFKQSFLAAQKLNPEGGVCLEFGVGMGRSFSWSLMQIVRNSPNSKLLGFDGWKGLPKEDSKVWCPDHHTEGKLCWSKAEIFKVFKDLGVLPYIENDPRFYIVDGWFCDTLTPALQKMVVSLGSLIFVNCDVDIFISTEQMLNWITPLLRVGTIIYLDDWRDPTDNNPAFPERKWGEHLAWEQWTQRNPNLKFELLVCNELDQRSYQCVGVQ
jgi:hypothetical protein